MTLPSFVMAAALGFAHTLGEFGVVLMIGGNIPGRPRCSPSPCLITWKPWIINMPTTWQAA